MRASFSFTRVSVAISFVVYVNDLISLIDFFYNVCVMFCALYKRVLICVYADDDTVVDGVRENHGVTSKTKEVLCKCKCCHHWGLRVCSLEWISPIQQRALSAFFVFCVEIIMLHCSLLFFALLFVARLFLHFRPECYRQWRWVDEISTRQYRHP